MGRHVRKGDLVIVNAGKHRGQKGKVVEVLTEANRVRIEGMAVVKRHLKANQDPKRPDGGIIEKLGSIHMSNVQPVDPKSGKATRVQFKMGQDGQKIRTAQRSGESLGQL